MNLMTWIILGFIINLLLKNNDPYLKKESFLAAAVIISIRAIAGGILSNYIFDLHQGGSNIAGLDTIDPLTFTYLGIMPLIFLLIGKKFYRQLT